MNITRVRQKYLTRSLLHAGVIFAITFSVFLVSKVRQVADSNYSMVLSQSLLAHQTFALDNYNLPRYQPEWHGYYYKNGPIYQLEFAGNHLYYHFPPGTSVLSAPFVAVLNLFGVSAINPDGTYNRRGEVALEAVIAALLMAILAALFFVTSRMLLSPRWSAMVAIGGSLGTQIYSTASRALWSETWGILLLGVVLLLILRAEVQRVQFSPALLATLLSWMYFTRPTFAIAIAAITVYVFLFYRQLFLRYAITGAAWLCAFVTYSWIHFHQALPNYYRASRIGSHTFWTALAGNLISPARGLLVYVPVLLFVVFLLIAYRFHLRFHRLIFMSTAVIAAHLLLISGFSHWWGGHSFGPRFSTGLVPWFVLLAILAMDAFLRAYQSAGVKSCWWRTQLICGGLLLLGSVFIHTRGAAAHQTWLWNQRPKGVDQHPERLWDWRQPQFLAGYLPYPTPRDVALLDSPIEITDAENDRVLWYGWQQSAGRDVWAEKEAAIYFSLPKQETTVLKLNVVPFVIPAKLEQQRVAVMLNNQPLTQLVFSNPAPANVLITLPAAMLRRSNAIVFRSQDAESPLKLGLGGEATPRAFKLVSIEKQ